MNRKITLFALAARGGALGAIGLTNGDVPSAATACRARNPSAPSRPVSATPPKPPPISHKNSRRVRPQNEDDPEEGRPRAGSLRSMAGPSIEVEEPVGIEHQQGVLRQRGALVEAGAVA